MTGIPIQLFTTLLSQSLYPRTVRFRNSLQIKTCHIICLKSCFAVPALRYVLKSVSGVWYFWRSFWRHHVASCFAVPPLRYVLTSFTGVWYFWHNFWKQRFTDSDKPKQDGGAINDRFWNRKRNERKIHTRQFFEGICGLVSHKNQCLRVLRIFLIFNQTSVLCLYFLFYELIQLFMSPSPPKKKNLIFIFFSFLSMETQVPKWMRIGL